MVLTSKERHGSKVTKHYDTPKTPYQRVIASACVAQEVKDRLKNEYQTLNPARLKRKLLALTRLLLKSPSRDAPDSSTSKPHTTPEEGGTLDAAN